MVVKPERMFTYHIQQDRERKNLAILELIRKRSPISKAEISRTLGYNIVTITNYLDYYIDKKMVLEIGLDISSGGRRPELLELNAKAGYVVGVNIGPEIISAMVANMNVKMISDSGAARPPVKMDELTPNVIEVIDKAVVKSKIDRLTLKIIGIGISGIVDHTSGTIRDTDASRGRTKANFTEFAKAIEQKFNIPVFIGNDASCAAFGEKILNPGADVESLIYVYADVGCGMIVHGDVYIGSSGCSGETQVTFDAINADDRTVILKEYALMKPRGVDLGIVDEARKAIEKGISTEILTLSGGNANAVTRENVINAAKKGDGLALELIRAAGKSLGVKVAYLINFMNPAVIVIGGGMEKAGDILLDPLKEMAKKLAFEEPMSAVKIMPSLLGENAVAIGTAALAAREVFIQA